MARMKLRNIKFGKIAIVIFITVLIWVWADLALDEKLNVSNTTITVAKSNPKLWVTINEASSVSIEEVVVKGPLRRISELRRKLEEQGGLEISFDATEEKMDQSGSYTLPLIPFIQKNKEIKQFGLKVESCNPESLSVNVRGLVKKSLTVECLDENKIPLKAESIEPPKVDMFVPEDWQGEKLVAKVQLTRREINQAGVSVIKKIPYIELAADQRRQAAISVEIKMPPVEVRLKDYTITTATLGFSLSENLQGKYKVNVTNLNEVISPIAIRATPEAKQAYEGMRYQVILDIYDEDIKAEEPRRLVVYNFPQEFVRKDEIVLSQAPVQARFKLAPVSAAPE